MFPKRFSIGVLENMNDIKKSIKGLGYDHWLTSQY